MPEFTYDLSAKKVKLTDAELLSSLEGFAEEVDFRYFPTTEYDRWKTKIATSNTIVKRFGSWNKALRIIGIEGGHERRYTPEELIENLEVVWKELGYPPGKRRLSKYGLKISETPYKKIWGSIKSACEFIYRYHEGKISREELLKDNIEKVNRDSIPLKVRWEVLKRDNYKCAMCG